jgi:hypothetical protein
MYQLFTAHKKSEIRRVGQDEHVARHNNICDSDELRHANRVHRVEYEYDV